MRRYEVQVRALQLLLVKVRYKTLLKLSFTSVKAHTDRQQRYPWSALLFQGQLERKLATVQRAINEHVFVNCNYLSVTSGIPAIRYTNYALIHTITNTGICQYRDTTKYRYTAQLYNEVDHNSPDAC